MKNAKWNKVARKAFNKTVKAFLQTLEPSRESLGSWFRFGGQNVTVFAVDLALLPFLEVTYLDEKLGILAKAVEQSGMYSHVLYDCDGYSFDRLVIVSDEPVTEDFADLIALLSDDDDELDDLEMDDDGGLSDDDGLDDDLGVDDPELDESCPEDEQDTTQYLLSSKANAERLMASVAQARSSAAPESMNNPVEKGE